MSIFEALSIVTDKRLPHQGNFFIFWHNRTYVYRIYPIFPK
ncbi:hypothetical protein SAMN05518672_110156 [Chitinophaga sp. CF118]|nr:hypothetical protein SAMN05518672_110156 [Chitinophaga sp. CF118]